MVVNSSPGARSRLELRWERADRHRPFTRILALLGLGIVALAGTMAVVGLPPVDLHGPLHKVGIMDPLCGGTRAARYTAQGELVAAWRYNPLGIVVVAGSVLLLARAALGALAHRWLNLHLQLTPRGKRLLLAGFGVLLLMLEIRQQMRADLLMAGTSTLWG
jgi:hypothetical protein